MMLRMQLKTRSSTNTPLQKHNSRFYHFSTSTTTTMSSSRSRRSARSRGSNEVVAPGLGTKGDIAKLTKDLGGDLPENAVLAMMKAEGRGIKGRSEAPGTPTKSGTSAVPFASPGTSNMWADFIQEEGMASLAGAAASEDGPPSKKAKTNTGIAGFGAQAKGQVDYDLSSLTEKKKAAPFGSLVQTGPLDASLVGRGRISATDKTVYNLEIPTILLPSIKITTVCTSCNAAHAIAIDQKNQAYGWGRNEGMVLGDAFGDSKVVPTPQVVAEGIATAALGKSHTIFLKTDGTLHALGTNKSGQCGWRQNIKQMGTLKPCLTMTPKGEDGTAVKFCKIACGEDFSLALDTEGILYSTGSSEFGQLGNGETGEYFVTANKVSGTGIAKIVEEMVLVCDANYCIPLHYLLATACLCQLL